MECLYWLEQIADVCVKKTGHRYLCHLNEVRHVFLHKHFYLFHMYSPIQNKVPMTIEHWIDLMVFSMLQVK